MTTTINTMTYIMAHMLAINIHGTSTTPTTTRTTDTAGTTFTQI